MKNIKISFKNFWYDFNTTNNIFTSILKKKWNVIIDDINPDYIFTGDKNIINKNKCNIYFSGEPSWDKGNCDWGLVQYDIYDKPNYIRFPLYLYYIHYYINNGSIKDYSYFYNEKNFNKEFLNQKTNFCNFICGGPYNGNGQYRDYFVKELMKYKNIHCPGTRFNNIGRLLGDSSNGLLCSSYKTDFIKKYKFTIGFENNSTRDGYNGYTTEKFIEPLLSNSMLIYWGNPNISNEFNTNSFINFHDYNDIDLVINKIIELDNNDDLYLERINNPYTLDNDYFNQDYLISLFEKIFN